MYKNITCQRRDAWLQQGRKPRTSRSKILPYTAKDYSRNLFGSQVGIHGTIMPIKQMTSSVFVTCGLVPLVLLVRERGAHTYCTIVHATCVTNCSLHSLPPLNSLVLQSCVASCCCYTRCSKVDSRHTASMPFCRTYFLSVPLALKNHFFGQSAWN